MYLTRKSIFLLKKFAQNRRETKLQVTFTPGWEAHPGVKVGCSFVARQKKPFTPGACYQPGVKVYLYSRLVRRTGSKGTFTPGWGMAPGVKGYGLYIPGPSSSLRSSPIPLPCAHATPRTPPPPRPTLVVTTASRASAVPTPPRAPTTSLLLPALAQRAPAAAW